MYFICPGIHDPKFTISFVETLIQQGIEGEKLLILPTDNYPPFSGFHVFCFLNQCLDNQATKKPLTIISFSAGVVGAIVAAWMWQRWGRKIKTFIAVDGWGMPLKGNFPIYSLSHDFFTYVSWGQWNHNCGSFYAKPSVEHLQLWQSPAQVKGWALGAKGQPESTTALQFLLSAI